MVHVSGRFSNLRHELRPLFDALWPLGRQLQDWGSWFPAPVTF